KAPDDDESLAKNGLRNDPIPSHPWSAESIVRCASGSGSVSDSGLWWADGGGGPSNSDRVQCPPPANPPPARLFPDRLPRGASRVAERPGAKPGACAGFARP